VKVMKKVMKKVMIPAAVIAVLSVASPAFAIHDPFVPAGNCAASNSQAVGHPATGKANTAFANSVLAERNNADPPARTTGRGDRASRTRVWVGTIREG
jgi:hypothetical protein